MEQRFPQLRGATCCSISAPFPTRIVRCSAPVLGNVMAAAERAGCPQLMLSLGNLGSKGPTLC